jgi:predicted aldo/keto reductase-like oxidoreductase
MTLRPRAEHPMEYRRFGKTELKLSVVTLGGMRYPGGWCKADQIDALPLPDEGLAACLACTQAALDSGINHVETALHYGLSERYYGQTWRHLRQKRDAFYLMTKGSPKDYDDAMRTVETQLRRLQADRFDLYGWHGINLPEHLETIRRSDAGSAMAALRKLQGQGVIGHLGFSTHGPLDIILKAIETDQFEFVNLHYYYFFQRNWPAVALAAGKDMGVFIISPNDKGGHLFAPPEKLARLCAPWTPIQFNARFCLSRPQIHTLSFGIDKVEYLRQALSVPNDGLYLGAEGHRIKTELDRQVALLGGTYCTDCGACLPCPENVAIPEILRFRDMWKAYDMEGFGRYRYNMLEEKGHWFPGRFGSACTDCGDCLPRCPEKLNIPALLRETHAGLFDPSAPPVP